MMSPRYRDVRSETISELSQNPNVTIKTIAGQLNRTKVPVHDLIVDTEYFDITMAPNTEFEIATKPEYKTFVFVFEGSGYFDPDKIDTIRVDHLVVFDQGDSVKVQTKSELVRFLFVSSKPLSQPISWRGPIVMNTDEELMVAFQEFRNGTFINKT